MYVWPCPRKTRNSDKIFIFEVVYLCICVCYVFMCFYGVCVCECVHVCTCMCVCLPLKSRRVSQMSWSWFCRWLWATQHGRWNSESGPHDRAEVLWTTEPSRQSLRGVLDSLSLFEILFRNGLIMFSSVQPPPPKKLISPQVLMTWSL